VTGNVATSVNRESQVPLTEMKAVKMPHLHLAVAQMTSTDSVAQNFEQIVQLIDSIPVTRVVDLLCFPENCLYLRVVEGEAISGLNLQDSVFQNLSEIAIKRQISLHLGSVALQEQATGKLINATVFIEKTGQIEVTYAKMHLFDIHLSGQKPIRESDVFAAGVQPEILQLQGWLLGQSICYDLRFAELYSQYARAECEALLVPSSFLVPTGEKHWHVLLRARAIESQAYVIAAAQAGEHKSSRSLATRKTYGHSLVIDPWGETLCEGAQTGQELLFATLNLEKVAEVRRQIPMAQHRRILT